MLKIKKPQEILPIKRKTALAIEDILPVLKTVPNPSVEVLWLDHFINRAPRIQLTEIGRCIDPRYRARFSYPHGRFSSFQLHLWQALQEAGVTVEQWASRFYRIFGLSGRSTLPFLDDREQAQLPQRSQDELWNCTYGMKLEYNLNNFLNKPRVFKDESLTVVDGRVARVLPAMPEKIPLLQGYHMSYLEPGDTISDSLESLSLYEARFRENMSGVRTLPRHHYISDVNSSGVEFDLDLVDSAEEVASILPYFGEADSFHTIVFEQRLSQSEFESTELNYSTLKGLHRTAVRKLKKVGTEKLAVILDDIQFTMSLDEGKIRLILRVRF